MNRCAHFLPFECVTKLRILLDPIALLPSLVNSRITVDHHPFRVYETKTPSQNSF